MTFREKVTAEYPEVLDGNKMGGVRGCPVDYGYENSAMCPTVGINPLTGCIDCTRCWDREIPGTEAAAPETDPVSHPSHYTSGSVECIEAIDSAVTGLSGFEAVYIAQVLKYIWRYKRKNGVEDLRKAQWYLNRLINKLEGTNGSRKA